MTFSGVVTTGIYCRPGCGGRPSPVNVVPFDSPAAAEAAGFRACLQCRPYRWPVSNGIVGPELVCRAVRLVVDGALDGSTEAELGARLGVSARHLRRLFVDHVGATPDQLARSRRAHFARRLLDDTDLPIADVAFAAGFGSVRQFNRVCREVFGAPPRELRARRRKADRLVADGGLLLRVAHEGPLDWPAALSHLQRRAIAGVEHVDAGSATYRRTVTIGGAPGVIEIGQSQDGELWLRTHLPQWEGLIHLVGRVRGQFGLDLDLASAGDVLGADPVIGPLLAARPGLRTLGTWDPFEAGVRAIVGQQVSVAGAVTVLGRIAERHGTDVGGIEQLSLNRVFPSAEVLVSADLDGLGLIGARVQALRSFAGAVLGGDIVLDRSVSLDDLIASITAVRGLGPWTATVIALRLGEPDAFPAGDLGIRKALGDGEPVSASIAAERSEAWRPWRALAATHLWAADA